MFSWHVIPLDDSEEHEDNESCRCLPNIVETKSAILIIHNAFDGRDMLEELKNNVNLN